MPTSYSKSCPNLIKDENGNVTEIHHNHYSEINYQSYQNYEHDKKELDQIIDQQKVALKGCITFFKTVVDNKNTDPMLQAAAKCALEEDKARLADFQKHRRLGCSIQ